MSVGISTAPVSPEAVARVKRRATVSLLVAVLFLVLICLLVLSGLLVRIESDRNGKAILPRSVAGGATVSGELTLSNAGLLPIQVVLEPRTPDDLRPTSFPGSTNVAVQRAGGEMLYDGPLVESMGPLLVLQPGESVKLRVAVSSTDLHAAAAVPLNYTYHWNARAAVPWWWWAPVFLIVLALLAFSWWRPRRAGDVT